MIENLKILLVDDNEEFSLNVKDVLELKEYEVLTAGDGFKALDVMKQIGIDLVLMDIKMPVMNGVETYRKMKEIAPRTPVIMVTAFAVEELIRESFRNGAFCCLRKPIDFEKLFVMIKDALPNGSMILVVADDENLCKNIKDVLGQKGYRVTTALDSYAAIHRAEEHDFDIMLLDMKLPPLNGLETYLKIKDIRPNMVVIAITDYLAEIGDMVEDAVQEGVYACIEKPIDMDQLFSLLEQIKQQKEKEMFQKPE